jgi:hypothetical protein
MGWALFWAIFFDKLICSPCSGSKFIKTADGGPHPMNESKRSQLGWLKFKKLKFVGVF